MKIFRTSLAKKLVQSTFSGMAFLALSVVILAGGCDLGTYSQRYSGPDAKSGAAPDAEPDAAPDTEADASKAAE